MTDSDIQVAKATLAAYIKETAKAQVAYDRMAAMTDDPDDPGFTATYVQNSREAKRLAFCKTKVQEWTNEVERLEQERHAEIEEEVS